MSFNTGFSLDFVGIQADTKIDASKQPNKKRTSLDPAMSAKINRQAIDRLCKLIGSLEC